MFSQEIEDKFKARTSFEVMLAKHNIPPQYWGASFSSVRFSAIKHGRSIITVAKQRTDARSIATAHKRGVSIIASKRTDTAALLLSSAIVQERVRQTGNSFLWLDSQNLHAWKKAPSLVIIYNIIDNATTERLQAIRDAIFRFRYSMCILAVSGCPNPVKFSTQKLCMSVDMHFLVDCK